MSPKKKSKNVSKKKRKKLKFLKWTSLFVIMAVAIVLFLLSDIFNIKEIKVVNNNKVSAEEIKALSTLQVDENMFKFFKIAIEEKIKQNPYIESVNIHRKLNRNN